MQKIKYFEKVNPMHIDKIADRIGGAMVDLAYKRQTNPKIAGEILIGHNKCYIITETSVHFEKEEVLNIVKRITRWSNPELVYVEVPQDPHLALNQKFEVRCGDNGIFSGYPIDAEEQHLTDIVKLMYEMAPYDGKYLIDDEKIVCSQSGIVSEDWRKKFPTWTINQLGDWESDNQNDSGAANRKLGSDMGKAITGGGLHFKDLSKADVSVNIYCHVLAQKCNQPVRAICTIGDKEVKVFVNGAEQIVPFEEIVDTAWEYIEKVGGFEKFAEWGLIR